MSELDLAPEVLVVGGGIAGVLAAVRAREQGARVTLVHRPGGGTSASSGAIDVADDLVGLVPGGAFDPFERGSRWRRAADVVAARHPRHPYARLGDKGRDRLREAVSLLKQTAADVELVERDDGANHVVATQLGTVKRAAFVQRCQLLDLAAMEGEIIVGVVEPADLGNFSARPVVHMLTWILGLGNKRLQVTTVPVERTLPARELHGSPAEMAARLDDPSARAAFIEALKQALRKQARPPHHLLLPPILGLEKTSAVVSEIERAIGKPVRELLALPASAPGERLQRALLAGARRKGVSVMDGAATHATTAEGRAAVVVVEGPQLRVELKPKAVVLASGRFLGGGIIRDQVAREALFNLPVQTAGNVIGESFIGDHLGDVPDAEHAIFRAGVAIADDLRPLDASGRVALENVFCAGSVVEGWDPARDGGGAGVSALTGFLAGERAARMASSSSPASTAATARG